MHFFDIITFVCYGAIVIDAKLFSTVPAEWIQRHTITVLATALFTPPFVKKTSS